MPPQVQNDNKSALSMTISNEKNIGFQALSLSHRVEGFRRHESHLGLMQKDIRPKEKPHPSPPLSNSASHTQQHVLTIGTLRSLASRRGESNPPFLPPRPSTTPVPSTSSPSVEVSSPCSTPSPISSLKATTPKSPSPPSLKSPVIDSIWPWDACSSSFVAVPPSPCANTLVKELGVLRVIPQTPAPGQPKQEPYDYFSGYFHTTATTSSISSSLSSSSTTPSTSSLSTTGSGIDPQDTSGSQHFFNPLPVPELRKLRLTDPRLPRSQTGIITSCHSLPGSECVQVIDREPVPENPQEVFSPVKHPPHPPRESCSESGVSPAPQLSYHPPIQDRHGETIPTTTKISRSTSKVSRPPKRFATFRPSSGKERNAWVAVAQSYSLPDDSFCMNSSFSLSAPISEELGSRSGRKSGGLRDNSSQGTGTVATTKSGSIKRSDQGGTGDGMDASISIDSVLSSLGSFHQPLTVTLTFDPSNLAKEAELVKGMKLEGSSSPISSTRSKAEGDDGYVSMSPAEETRSEPFDSDTIHLTLDSGENVAQTQESIVKVEESEVPSVPRNSCKAPDRPSLLSEEGSSVEYTLHPETFPLSNDTTSSSNSHIINTPVSVSSSPLSATVLLDSVPSTVQSSPDAPSNLSTDLSS